MILHKNQLDRIMGFNGLNRVQQYKSFHIGQWERWLPITGLLDLSEIMS